MSRFLLGTTLPDIAGLSGTGCIRRSDEMFIGLNGVIVVAVTVNKSTFGGVPESFGVRARRRTLPKLAGRWYEDEVRDCGSLP